MISRVFLRSRSFQLLPAYCLFWSLVVKEMFVMSSNPGLVELAVLGTSVLSCTYIKISIASASVYLTACAFEIISDL